MCFSVRLSGINAVGNHRVNSMLNWLIFGCFEKCDEPSGDVGFNFGLNVFIITFRSSDDFK